MALTAVEQRVLPTLVALRAAQSLAAGVDAAAQAAAPHLPTAHTLQARTLTC